MAAMVFDWANVGTPFFWCFVAALFAGAAAARIFRRERRPQRWALVYLYLSVFVATASAGILVPGLERFLDPRIAYFSVGVGAVAYLAFRHKIAIGVPVLLIAIVVVMLFGASLREWLPVRGSGAELAEVQVLGRDGSRIDLETTPLVGEGGGSTVTGTLPAGSVAPVVEVLKVNPYYFFLASPLLGHFDGLTSGGGTQATLSLPGAASAGEAIVAHLPGVRHLTIVGKAIDPVMLQKYRVRLSSELTAGFVLGSS